MSNDAFTSEIGKNGKAAAEAAKKSRANKALADWTDEEEQQNLIKSVFRDAMKEGVAEYVRVQAADKLLSNRHREHEMEVKQRERYEDRLDRAQALDLLEDRILKLIEQGKMSPEIIDAFADEIVEVEPLQIEAGPSGED